MSEWAGLSMGKGETYRLYLSIKKKAESLSGTVRFFGKISTRTFPYYIIEGPTDDDVEDKGPFLEGNSGANKYTYWVTQSVESGAWTKLPNVTTKQVVAARQFKRFFTGDLEAPVPSYPPFPGKENSLLRTQIARIVGETSISPDGFYGQEDEESPVARKPEEEIDAPKTVAELKEAAGWRHHEIELNEIGRATPLEAPEGDDEDAADGDEPVPVTPSLSELKPENWTFRVCPGGAGQAESSLVVARSLAWPGAVALSVGKRFLNLYFGNGVSSSGKTYTPPLPSVIQSEWAPEEDQPQLFEQDDIRVDPTPPKEEDGEGEE